MLQTRSPRFTFVTLLLVVAISGMSQGLTLPLLSVLLEQAGASSVANGFNAAALYLGILLVSPLMELPLRRFGYRTTLLLGLLLVTASTLLLPVLHGLTIWFLLRLLLGIGDMALHYSAQLWVNAIAPVERRGRYLSIYGFAYSAGFSVGPLGMFLQDLGLWAPFLAISVFYAIAFLMLIRLPNTYPEAVDAAETPTNRYFEVLRFGWLAFIPPFLFGYMESSLNSNFPIYLLRKGVSLDWVPMLLPSFVIGSLLLQMPLGRWSDRLGRQRVLVPCSLIGALCFVLLPFVSQNVWAMIVLLTLAGAFVGSFYTLGLTFAADVVPPGLLSTAGAIASILFGMANLVAPSVNGYLLGTTTPDLMFYVLGGMLTLFVAASFRYRPRNSPLAQNEKLPHLQ